MATPDPRVPEAGNELEELCICVRVQVEHKAGTPVDKVELRKALANAVTFPARCSPGGIDCQVQWFDLEDMD
mgnify:CR=1 FL=1